MSPPVVLSKQHARCSADLRLLAAHSAIEAREEGTGVEGSSACRQSVAAVNKQNASIASSRDGARRAVKTLSLLRGTLHGYSIALYLVKSPLRETCTQTVCYCTLT